MNNRRVMALALLFATAANVSANDTFATRVRDTVFSKSFVAATGIVFLAGYAKYTGSNPVSSLVSMVSGSSLVSKLPSFAMPAISAATATKLTGVALVTPAVVVGAKRVQVVRTPIETKKALSEAVKVPQSAEVLKAAFIADKNLDDKIFAQCSFTGQASDEFQLLSKKFAVYNEIFNASKENTSEDQEIRDRIRPILNHLKKQLAAKLEAGTATK